MRRNFEDGREITNQDLNKISSSLERQLYDNFLHYLVFQSQDSFFGNSFKVNFTSATEVSITAGIGIQNDTSVVEPEPQNRVIRLASSETKTISVPTTGDRIDIVCVKADRV